MNTKRVSPPSGQATSSPSMGVLRTSARPLEKLCTVSDPVLVEYKGERYPTLFRGAKSEFVDANLAGGGKANLVPVKETSYVLIDCTKALAATEVEFGAPFVVRFLSGGMVYAFRSALLRRHQHPPMLALEYPEQLERRNLRASERLVVMSPAQVSVNGGTILRGGALIDLSAQGALIGVENMNGAAVGTKLGVSFVLPSGAPITNIGGIIRNMRQQEQRYFFGISFMGSDPAVVRYYNDCVECLG